MCAADRVPQPWKNGGGITQEVAVFPPGAGMGEFEWRVSIAEVSVAGPFSRFDGIDRILTVLDGRLRLEIEDEAQELVLGTGDSHAFRGEAAVVGTPVAAAIRDLNIMVKRDRWRARIAPYTFGHTGGDVRIAIAGRDCPKFAPLDALLLAGEEELPSDFRGYLICLDRIASRAVIYDDSERSASHG